MVSLTYQERWKRITGFPNYEISNVGRVYNSKSDRIMKTSKTTFGHAKISLLSNVDNTNSGRQTMSVAKLVAEAFVDRPTALCDQVVILDGDLENLAAYNLVWRPSWYAWKYVRQLQDDQPNHFYNLAVHNVTNDITYNSVVEAGMAEGLLFTDIWRSTYSGAEIFPGDLVFVVAGKKRV